MNTTTITNATNGAIISVRTFYHPHHDYITALLAAVSLALISAGLYLLFRKEKSR